VRGLSDYLTSRRVLGLPDLAPELEASTGLRFPAALRESDIRAELAAVDRRSPLQDIDDIRW
jgi:hypothetical protein